LSDGLEFHVIVVGAGSAGCAVAARLSEDAATHVLLIEAGGHDGTPLFAVPGCQVFARDWPRYAWLYDCEPDASRLDRADQWRRGRILGGSSTINGLIWAVGLPSDYDAWAAGLQQACLPVAVDSPDAGRHLQEHPAPCVEYEVAQPTYTRYRTPVHMAAIGLQWALVRRGPATSPGSHILGHAHSGMAPSGPPGLLLFAGHWGGWGTRWPARAARRSSRCRPRWRGRGRAGWFGPAGRLPTPRRSSSRACCPTCTTCAP
jgi:choline dehydrogenase-like flavoprotein